MPYRMVKVTRSKKVRAEGPAVSYQSVIKRLSEDPETRRAIEAIVDAGPQINRLAEQAAKDVEAIEMFLRETAIGVGGRVLFRPSRDIRYLKDGLACDAVELWGLHYGRVAGEGEFRIYITHRVCERVPSDPHTGGIGDDLTWEERPWHQWPREIRLESHRFLPKLLQDIAQGAAVTLEAKESLFDWDASAVFVADYAAEDMSVHRGWIEHPNQDGYIAIFGNDGYAEDARSKREVEIIKQQLSLAGHDPLGFGVNNDGYTWAMIYREDAADDALGISLSELIGNAWAAACEVERKEGEPEEPQAFAVAVQDDTPYAPRRRHRSPKAD